jgi:hypothetical protein
LAIRLLGLVSLALAGRWVYRLWFQPLRFPEPPQEKEWRRTAQPIAVAHRGQALAVDSSEECSYPFSPGGRYVKTAQSKPPSSLRLIKSDRAMPRDVQRAFRNPCAPRVGVHV